MGLKILHIGKYYPPFRGGVEKVTHDLVSGFRDEKHIVDVVSFNHKKGSSQEKTKSGTVYRFQTILKLFGQPLSLKALLFIYKKTKDYDLVHLHLPNPLLSMIVLLVKKQSKLIVHWHNDITKQKYLLLLYKPFQTKILNSADLILGSSPQYIKSSKYLKPHSHKSIVVPLGVNKEDLKYSYEFYKKIQIEYKSKTVILSVGRLSKYKGFEYLIKSAKYMDNDTCIIIIGNGSELPFLKKTIWQESLDEKVKILTEVKQNQLGAYYKLCNVFCMSSISRNEGFGLVQIEAMLFRKPIITTNINGSGIAYGNIHQKTGIVVPVKDSLAIFNAYKQITKSDADYNYFSKNAFDRANKIFRKDQMIKLTLKAYNSVLCT